ncbi:unnamed protein product [Cyprideis torosa]|uniref:Uncharacterized protein n=1 Tax=Cyprideis torosa TaxID=163714 RepID=A0A7R8WKH7_9CRUS|nr:unnamed protein product [Cyprideis torosa]CAG0903184.1 unnamed protein product [Cyprideis torosa]
MQEIPRANIFGYEGKFPGHVCGDAVDLIRGRPTGAVRISFGYMSQRKDVETIVKILKENFIENSPPNDLHVISNGLKENRAPTSSIWLSGLSLYPIKSCAAQSIEGSWPLDDKGLQFDRHWLITTGSGVAVTQKRLPQLAVVHPNVQLSKHRLQLNATATEVLDPITIPLDHDAGELSSASLCSVRVCGDRVPANVLDDVEVSDWLRDVTGTEGLRLTEQTEVIRKCRLKNVAGENSTPISFANESQFVLVSLVSIRQLKDWMKARNPSATLDQEAEHLVSRFRPNIVIDGDIDAFEEDNWKTLQIGNQVFESLGPCNRCQMVCIDQKTGEKSKEPLTTLSTFRGPRIPFGIHLRMINQGTHAGETPRLTIGDEVTITERQVNATNGLQ